MKTIWIFLLCVFACCAQYVPILGSDYPANSLGILNSKPSMRTGAIPPTGNCTAGLDLYVDTATQRFYYCGMLNVWILAGQVTSIFGRNGVVTAQSGDYTAAQVTNAVDSTVPIADPAWITALSANKITSGSLALARIAQGGATTNQVLTWNGSAWAPAAASGGGLVIENNGTPVPPRNALSIIPAAGIITAFSDSSSPSRTSVTFGADTSVLLTQSTAQSGTPFLCAGSGPAAAQTCNMTPALGAYTPRMVLQFVPGTTNTGAVTLAINGLTALNILRHDGTTPSAGELVAGRQYPISNDGTAFRLTPSGGGGTNPGANGLQAWTSGTTWTQRTITAGSGPIAVTNGDGVSGNPIISSTAITQAVSTQNSMVGTCLANDAMQQGADWMMPQSSSSLAPSTACQPPGGGSNNYRLPTMSFTTAANQEVVLVRVLPINRIGNIDLHLYVSDNFGSGVFKLDVTKACLTLGAAFDPVLAYTDQQSIQWTSSITAFAYRTLTNVTVPSACQPGDTIYLRIKRDGAVLGNSGGTARLVSAYTVMRSN